MPDNLTPVFSDPIPAAICPECGGAHIPNHPGGPLYFKHAMTCSLLAAEDARAVADKDGPGERPATPTERVLLSALGFTVADDASCLVQWLTPGVRRRTFLGAVVPEPEPVVVEP
jgi:hypothetical protein